MKIYLFLAGFIFAAATAWAQQYLISTVVGGSPQPPITGTSTSTATVAGIAVDSSGNTYFSNFNCVDKLDSNGVLTVVAGNSRPGYSGDGGPATSAELNRPYGVALDGLGNLYIADSNNQRIRRVSPQGIITTIAGVGTFVNGFEGTLGAGGPATSAHLYYPQTIAADNQGNVYLMDISVNKVWKISTTGIFSLYLPQLQLSSLTGMATDAAGNFYIADSFNHRIIRVSSDGTITTIAGNGTVIYSGDGGPATSAGLYFPERLTTDSTGNLYFIDDSRVRRISTDGIITTVAGSGSMTFSGDGGPAIDAGLTDPVGIGVANDGTLYIADTLRIRKVSPGGIISTIAGNGAFSYSGDGGPAVSAIFQDIGGLALDNDGNIFISDGGNNAIRKVSAQGIITTLTAIALGAAGVAVDGAGNLYVAEVLGNVIQKISPAGVITTVAGTGSQGYSGDGGPATKALLNHPYGVAVDDAGNIYIADTLNFRIRKVAPDGIIQTVAGNGTGAHSGDGGPAVDAELGFPFTLALDGLGNFYFDEGDYRIRKVSADGIIATIAGTGTTGYSGDGGPAIAAEIGDPYSLAADSEGNLFLEDANRVRKISTGGTMSTIAGTGTVGYTGDGGVATAAELTIAAGITVDSGGDIYIAGDDGVRLLQPTSQTVLVSAVWDAASESAVPITPGKIVVIYGSGLGPAVLAQNEPSKGVFSPQVGGTSVSFNGIPAPMIYSSANQASAIVPYGIAGSATAQVTVTSTNGVSMPFVVQVASSAPSFFSANATGAGQIAAVNLDNSLNDAAHPVKIGGYVSLYATGEGQTSPAGVDGQLASGPVYPQPLQKVQVSVGGVSAPVAYAGAAPTEVAGLMQVVIQIPPGVQTGGYVPVVLQIGSASTVSGAAWIAVSAN